MASRSAASIHSRGPAGPIAGLLISLLAGLPLAAQSADPIFEDTAAAAGLDFRHFNGMSGEFYPPEVMSGGGVALLDFDRDGDLDVYLVQGGMIGPGKTLADALDPPAQGAPGGDRLFRNDRDGGTLRFVDVTATAGLSADGYGFGAATGDYDGDGWLDIYLTNFGSNQLLRNNGDGTFSDTTAAAGVDDPEWSVPASFADFDDDGDLDLYVGNYLFYRFGFHRACRSISGTTDYCGPLAYGTATDRLFVNRGDGTFEDMTATTGLQSATGGALGAVARDFDGDGRVDIYVGNDMTPNHLWINQGDGTFVDDALLAGNAVNWEGQPEASMGIGAADFDGDGDQDLFLTHLQGETNTLYVNEGGGVFADRTLPAGLSAPSFELTSFGTGWIDFDNDADLDLVAVSGAVRLLAERLKAGEDYPLDQPNQLFENVGGTFVEVTERVPTLTQPDISRGTAFGDLDNDGRMDLVLTNNNGPARLLHNVHPAAGGWAGARFEHDPIGAKLTLDLGTEGEPSSRPEHRIHRRTATDGSYGSASDSRLTIGLGSRTPASVAVRLPNGRRLRWHAPPAARYWNFPANFSAGAGSRP